ncbi:hypothetical protein ACWFMI_09200 [Nocardiopsis terrae]
MTAGLGVSGRTRLEFSVCSPAELSVPFAVATTGTVTVVLVRVDLSIREILTDAALLLSASEQAALLAWLEARP